MYTKYFGLNAKPFELVPNPKFLFMSRGHRKALNYLRYSIQDRAGFTLLTGEVGSGKTTLVRNTIRQINANTPLAMIFNTCVDALQLLAMINEDFGLQIQGKDKVTLLGELNDFLVSQSVVGRLPILIIDEAQNLSAEALEEVRLLSNLEADSFKLLQILLVGQPELKTLISQPGLRQLRQRISISCHLGPLSRDETEDYIYHRLKTAGNREALVFQQGCLDLVHAHSGGVPRLVNVLCDFLLLSAYVDQSRSISLEMVREAVQELSLDAVEPSLQKNEKPQEKSVIEERMARMEAEHASLRALHKGSEAIRDRLSSHGWLLVYLINKQQRHFHEVGGRLNEITCKLEKMVSERNGRLANL